MDTIFGKSAPGAEMSVVQAELALDEKLLWAGKPTPGIRFQLGDLYMVPFSLVWAGFAFFWEFSVLTLDAPLLFKLWGIPFVLIGLYMIAGRFIIDSIRRNNTFYGLTDKRAIIITRWPRSNVQSISLRTLTQTNLKLGSEGRGTITFGAWPFWSPLATGSGWPTSATWYSSPSFQMIPQAREVYDLIQQAQANTGSGANTRPF